jgi:hypothetical protein
VRNKIILLSELFRDFQPDAKEEVIERTKSPSFLKLFNNTVLVARFNYSKLQALVSMVTSLDIVTVVKQWVQLYDTLLHSI